MRMTAVQVMDQTPRGISHHVAGPHTSGLAEVNIHLLLDHLAAGLEAAARMDALSGAKPCAIYAIWRMIGSGMYAGMYLAQEPGGKAPSASLPYC